MSKNKKILLILISITLIITISVGITYALWSQSHEQTNANLVESGCFEITFQEVTTKIDLVNAYPIEDELGLSSDAYTFKIKNTCNTKAEYLVKLEIVDNSTMPLNKVKVAIDNNISILDTNEEGISTLKKAGVNISDVYIIHTGLLESGEEVTHSLREWIDYSATTAEAANKTLNSYITIEASASDASVCDVMDKSILNNAILCQQDGKKSIEAKGNPAFNVVPTAQTSGIYATEDEYGMSYYYRGERETLANNLIFAGFQWKIVRVNGDGSVRIIYNGTETQFNSASTMNTTGVNTQVGTNAFNAQMLDNRHVGYIFGNSTATLVDVQTNTNNSAAKTYLDNWYRDNIQILATTITDKLTDNLFCNDRSVSSGTGILGSATYAPYIRHYTNRTNPTPTLKCAQQNDRFTVSDTAIGNGALTYPIGLITADEIAYGGNVYSFGNVNQYLSTSQSFWTMTPSNSTGKDGDIWSLYSSGVLYADFNNYTYGIRPVLNLRENMQVTSGDGSATNPFIIS